MATALTNGLGGLAGFGENALIATDDGSSAYIDLRQVFPLGLEFYGTVHNGLFVNNNGSVSFNTPVSAFTPTAFSSLVPIIGPYIADVDTRAFSAGLTPGGNSTGRNQVWYDLDAVNRVFTATWDDIGYFNRKVDKLNAFQLRLIGVADGEGEYSGDFDLEMRYEAVNWTTGDFSGGSGGLGGTVSRAGFGSGNGSGFYELPSSGNQSGMLALPTTTNLGAGGSDGGRYLFSFRGGVPVASVAIDDVVIAEGDGEPNSLAAVTLRLTTPSATPVSVDYATQDGGALAGMDYVARRGTVTFAPGTIEQTIFVEIIGDATSETDASFGIALSDATGALLADALATVTIRNDDGLAIGDVTAAEGNGPSPTSFLLPVRLLAASTGPVSVDYATGAASATAGSDFTSATGTLTFSAGETEKFISVTVAGDTDAEASETFTVTLSNPVGATLVDASGLATITNDDGFVIDDLRIVEGTKALDTSATLTIRLLSPLAELASIDWSTVDGTATSGVDLVASSGTAIFAAGETTATITVPVTADSETEQGETFTVVLSNPAQAAVADAEATVSIVDDDGLSIADVFVTEGDSGSSTATFTVTLRSTLPSTATVDYATVDGTATAGVDYTATSGTLTFSTGQTTRTFTVPVTGDTTAEGSRSFTIALSNATGGATIADDSATALILDNDGLVIGDATIAEGDSGITQVIVPVSLNTAAVGEVTVNWSTVDASATAGTDYTKASGSLTFASGETSKNITLDVLGETLFEGAETFRIELSDAVGSSIVDHSGTIVITNDDAKPTPALSVFGAALTEGDGAGTTEMHVTIGLSQASDTPVTVAYATSDGTATAGSDYTATKGEVVIQQGSLTATIAVPLLRDLVAEADETFTIDISTTTPDIAVATAQATATILSDETRIDIAPLAASKLENLSGGTTTLTFTVSRIGDTSTKMGASWSVVGLGADAVQGDDFVGSALPSGAVSFAPGETSKTVTINARDDSEIEADEAFAVVLSAPTGGATLGTQAALGSINNDDSSYTIVSTSAAKPEGTKEATDPTPFTFTVSRTGNTGASGSVGWSVIGLAGPGTEPSSATDFPGGALPSGTISFDAGETSKLLTVAVNADVATEPDERFMVLLNSPSGGATLGVAAAGGVVLNDDADIAAELAFTAGTVIKSEGSGGGATAITFTATRTGGTTGNHSAAWAVTRADGAGTLRADAKDFPGATLPSGIVTFLAGETSKPVTVMVAADTVPELNDRFRVTLSDPAGGATIADGAASVDGVIHNDDTVLSIAADQAGTAEGDGGGTTAFTFTVTRNGNNGRAVAAEWAVTGVAGKGTTAAGATDFADDMLPSGVVSFAAGERTKTITINVGADAEGERNERFRVTLSSPTGGAALGTASSDGVILNDDTVLALSASPGNRAEGSAGGTTAFTFAVTRSGNNGQTATAQWSVAGLAGAGTVPAQASDFAGSVLPSGSISFGAGETSKSITINVNADTAAELNERFALTLTDPTGGASLGTATLGAVILNDDAPPPGPAAAGPAFALSDIDPNDLIPGPMPQVALALPAPGAAPDIVGVAPWLALAVEQHVGSEYGGHDILG